MNDKVEDVFKLTNAEYIVDLRSGKSKALYSIHVVWDWKNSSWQGLTCTCKSFEHRASCRHLETAALYIETNHAPPSESERPAVFELRDDKYWRSCSICGCSTFYIKPPVRRGDKILLNTVLVVCTQCGRQYEI